MYSKKQQKTLFKIYERTAILIYISWFSQNDYLNKDTIV